MFAVFKHIKFVFLGLFLIINFFTYGQDSLVTNRLLTIKNGFMWIGTNEGLNRFDGHEFKVFTKDNDGLKTNQISIIKENKHHFLWLLRDNNIKVRELSFLNTETLEISSFQERFGAVEGLIDNQLNGIFGNEKNELIISTKTNDVYLLNAQQKFIKLPIDEDFLPLTLNNNNELCGRKGNEIVQMNLNGQVLQTIPVGDESRLIRLRLLQDDKSRIWWTELITENKRKSITIKYQQNNQTIPLKTYSIKGHNNLFRIKYQRGKAIIYSRNFIEIYNLKTYQLEQKIPFNKIYKQQVFDVYIDPQNVVWIATRTGLFLLKIEKNYFEPYFNVDSDFILQSARGILELNERLYVNLSEPKVMDLQSKTAVFTFSNKASLGAYSIALGKKKISG